MNDYIGNVKVGQQYVMNRPDDGFALHVLGICMDMNGKYKITVQVQFPPQPYLKRHYSTPKLVSPQYFFGLTVRIGQ